VSAGLDPLVLAVGVEFGLLLEARYREERATGRLPGDAARVATQAVGAPVAVAAGTVGLGFLVLGLSDVPALRQFGIFAALELVLSVAAALVLVPAACAFRDAARSSAPQASRPGLLRHQRSAGGLT